MSIGPNDAELHHRLQLEREMSDLEVWAAITLTQPWASLMAFGHKRIETRGRLTNYRGWIAIHAAKGFPEDCRCLCGDEPFRGRLLESGYQRSDELPLGVVIAVLKFTNCVTSDSLVSSSFTGYAWDERAFGDYSFGRYGFITEGVRRLREPIPIRGFQSIPWRMPRPITLADLA
jgi:hypothetical protein